MADEKGVRVISIPVKLLASVVIEIDDELTEEEARKAASDNLVKLAEKFASSEKVKKAQLDFSETLSKEIEHVMLLVPGLLAPVEKEEDAKVVDQFINAYFEALGGKGEKTGEDERGKGEQSN